MLHDPTRHEPCTATPWHEARARAAIEQIVRDAEQRFSPDGYWPMHPLDADPSDPPGTDTLYALYFGACGVIWALHHLQNAGAVRLERSYAAHVQPLLALNRGWLGDKADAMAAAYLMGDTAILMLQQALTPSTATADRLAALIAGNVDHPARELMWGAPGTMLAALFLHEHDGDARWAELFRRSARRLWSQLLWSDEHQCRYWTQDLYGRQYTFLDAVHGFVATASVLTRGRALLDAAEWNDWQACIETTVRRTATLDAGATNWRVQLIAASPAAAQPTLVQFCHGAPGFAICLADLPGSALDDLLFGAGETTWRAGPLTKGSNLCHGTGGNGYAFLKLYRRSGDPLWLDRARAFAMHGIEQTERAATAHGQGRYSLWTGDLGFAVYLWACIQGTAAFPTLDGFFDAAG